MNEDRSLQKKSEEEIKDILYNGSYIKELVLYVRALEKYLGLENLSLCANNIESVKLRIITKEKEAWNPSRHYIPEYNDEHNIITILKQTDLSHEFIHMATADGDNCGFIIKSDKRRLNGINEGCTEFYNEKIYNISKKRRLWYQREMKIVKMLEIIYENPKDMEIDFFHANIMNFYKNFTKYGSSSQFEELFELVDGSSYIKNYLKALSLIYNLIRENGTKKQNNACKKLLLTDKNTLFIGSAKILVTVKKTF